MAEVEGSDGNQYNIPDFALEDTQEKILATMKKAYKLSDADIKNAQKALSNDNKNSKAQIDALNKLGADIKDAVDGKGTFFGGLSDATTATVGVLGTMGKVVGGVATGFGVLAASAAALAVNLSKGFGDAILPLAESGAAFGQLGKELRTTVPELMSFGLSVEEATGAVDGLRTNFEVLGSDATNALVGKFMEMTDLGSKFGKTQAESIEYLQEEFATRQMLGFFQQRSAAVEAKAAEEMLQTQIDASKLLGKSVQEIADGVKSLFGTEDFRASFARMGPEVADIMRQSFSVLTASNVPEELMAGLAKAMSDPIMMASEEAVDTFDALTQIAAEVDPGAADEIRQNVIKFREATDIGDTKAAEKYQKQIEEQTITLLGGVQGLDTITKKELQVRGEVNAALMGTMANQNALKIASDKYGKEEQARLADAARTSSYFNNIIDLISGSFDTLYMSVKAGIAPALQSFTDALGEMGKPDSPIRMFRDRLGAIGEDIVEKFNSIFGGAEKQEGAVSIVNSVLTTLGDAVEWAADKFLDFADLFLQDDGVPLMTKLGKYLGDLFSELVSIIGEQVRQIDIMDVLFGESEKEITDNAAQRVESARERRRGNQTDEQKSEGLMRAMSDIIDYRDEKNEKNPGSVDAEKMLEMVKKAGVDVQELTGEHLLQLFPDAGELRDAIASTYGEGATEAFANVSGKIIEHTKAQADNLENGLRSNFRKQEYTDELVAEQKAIQSSFLDALLPEIEVTAKKRSEKIEDAQTPVERAMSEAEKKREEIQAASRAQTGTPPVATSAPAVMTTPPEDETSAESPTSQDGTPTQAVKADPIGGDSTEAYVKELAKEIGLILNPTLSAIATNTKKTASGVASLPESIN